MNKETYPIHAVEVRWRFDGDVSKRKRIIAMRIAEQAEHAMYLSGETNQAKLDALIANAMRGWPGNLAGCHFYIAERKDATPCQ